MTEWIRVGMEWGEKFIYRLWRQDDNGNAFLVGEFLERTEAEKRLAELSRNPHKQIYWISQITGEDEAE